MPTSSNKSNKPRKRQTLLERLDDTTDAQKLVIAEIQLKELRQEAEVDKQLSWGTVVPQIVRPHNHRTDVYQITCSETTLLLIEEGVRRKIPELLRDLNQINFSENATPPEWSDEDGIFLARCVEEISQLLFQARFLRQNPERKQA